VLRYSQCSIIISPQYVRTHDARTEKVALNIIYNLIAGHGTFIVRTKGGFEGPFRLENRVQFLNGLKICNDVLNNDRLLRPAIFRTNGRADWDTIK